MFITAIILAALSAVGLAVGTHLQHRAIQEGAAPTGSRLKFRVARAFANSRWLLGSGIIVLGTAINIVALGLAPIVLVQPVGTLALVCTVVISTLVLGIRVPRGLIIGVSLAIASVAIFVGISAGFAREVRPSDNATWLLAGLLFFLILGGLLVARRPTGHGLRVVSAAILFGTVASAMHVVAVEILALIHFTLDADTKPGDLALAGGWPGFTDPASAVMLWTLVVLLLAATAVGAWLVQTAYVSGPPETVLAGLTVLDPVVAVLVGAFLLGEYSTIPPLHLVGLGISGLAACLGIAIILRNHPTVVGAAAPHGTDRIYTAEDEHTDRETADGITLENRRS